MFTFVTPKGERTRQRIIERSLALFAKRGYGETTLRDIAISADVSIGLAYRYFRRKEDLVLALYRQLSEEVERRSRLPTGSVGRRWAALERTRFAVLGPHRRTLVALAQAAFDSEGDLGVFSEATADVRALWVRLHRAVVQEADPPAPESVARILYALDLLLVLLWTQDRTGRATRKAVERIARLIDGALPLLKLPGAAKAMAELEGVFQSLIKQKEGSS